MIDHEVARYAAINQSKKRRKKEKLIWGMLDKIDDSYRGPIRIISNGKLTEMTAKGSIAHGLRRTFLPNEGLEN